MNMKQKREALATLIESTLNDVLTDGTTFNVVQRFRQSVERGAGQKIDRDLIMGNPVRYARVVHMGESPASEDDLTPYGHQVQVPHLFGVFIWFDYQDADSYEDSTQAVWDDLLESAGDLSATGLLPTLRLTPFLEGEGTDPGAYCMQPTDVIVPDEPLSMGDRDFCHYAQFFITIK